MRKTVFLLLVLCLIYPLAVRAQNFNYLGAPSSSVVSPSNASITSTAGISGTFTNVVTGQTGRQSCWLQYKPQTGLPVNAATAQGSVFFGVTAPTTLTSSFVLNAYGIMYCEQANEVEGNGVWVSGSATGDIFTIKVK
jgi:hypothetical protein